MNINMDEHNSDLKVNRPSAYLEVSRTIRERGSSTSVIHCTAVVEMLLSLRIGSKRNKHVTE